MPTTQREDDKKRRHPNDTSGGSIGSESGPNLTDDDVVGLDDDDADSESDRDKDVLFD